MSKNIISRIIDKSVVFSKERNDEIDLICKKFVKSMQTKGQSVDLYVNKRNTDKSKASFDIYAGKKAEFFVADFLRKNYNYPEIEIDVEIREGKDKNWEPDLPYSKYNNEFPTVHVKSCQKSIEQTKVKDLSWTFNWNNNNWSGKGRDVLFTSDEYDDDLIAFVVLDGCLSPVALMRGEDPKISDNAIVKAIVPWRIVKKEGRFVEPSFDDYKGIKKCVNFKSLLNDPDIEDARFDEKVFFEKFRKRELVQSSFEF